MKRIAVLVMVALITLSACATRGQKFEMSDVNAMQPGITTYREAVAKLGKPRSVGMAPDGSKHATWIWVQAGAFVGTQSRAVAIYFDKDEKMIRVNYRGGDQTD